MKARHLLSFSVLIAASLFIASISAFAAPTKKQEQDYQQIFQEETIAKQSLAWKKYILGNLKYTSIQSYCGREDKWLAFVDVYSVFEDGVEKDVLLGQATVQFGSQPLPTLSQKSVLQIAEDKHVQDYKKQSIFQFSNIPIDKSLIKSKDKDVELPIQLSVVVDGKTIQIPLVKDYPDEKLLSHVQAIEAMAPAYLDFSSKNKPSTPDHAFLRLRSYINDVAKMERSYTWELYLISQAKLPSKSTLIRYDCDTKKVTISSREVRDYFK